MTFISSLSLAILLASTAFSTPIQEVTSSSSSPGTPQSQNTFKPFLLESFRTQFMNNRQYMMFIARDQNFSPRSYGRCMSMVSGASGEQYGADTKEERMWRPVPGGYKADEPTSDANKGLTPFAFEVNPSQAKYKVGDAIDKSGWIACGDEFSFKTTGDIAVGENETIQFSLSIKQKLDNENTDGQFSSGEMIFTDDITVSCKTVASGSQTFVCLPTGESSFTFGMYEDFQKPENAVPEDTEVDEIENANGNTIEDTIESIFEDEAEDEAADEVAVEDEAEVELELEAQA